MEDEISKAFANFEIQVQWGDMDAAQHVNNLVFLRWVESARIEFLKKINNGSTSFDKVGPILAWHDCKYIFPVTYPDTIIVTYNVTGIEKDKLFCEAKLYSKRLKRLVAIAKNALVPYDYESLKKEPIPESWLKVIVEYYGSSIITES